MTPTDDASTEIASGDRFAFGDNWRNFLSTVDEARIAEAEQSLRRMLRVHDLTGQRFLDAGSGSGLFSLAARRLGAVVHSFDYDPMSVACTEELKRRYMPDDPHWTIERGSALDAGYLSGLGEFDVVYSWGVLHHTGNLREALTHIVGPVARGGRLFISIYNDQGITSRYWTAIKRIYNRSRLTRPLLIAAHAPYLLIGPMVVGAFTGRARPERGMSRWHDMLDWLGGYPFEVSRPEEIFRFFRERGFTLEELRTCGGKMGCNDFVFRRNADPPDGSFRSG